MTDHRADLSMLRDECLMLAAPMAMGTDGTTHSAMHQIRSYVVQLENQIADLAEALAAVGPDADLERTAEQHRTLAAFHAARPIGDVPVRPGQYG